jgi:hypothetical protein
MPSTGDRVAKRGNGVRLRTKRTSNIDRNFMITPNALLRGEGVYSVLSSFGRLLLAAGLSCGDHETTLDEMREWIPELGRNRHEALRRELRQHGFLSLYRTIIPPGQPDSGSFVWTFEFLMEPLPQEERDRLQERKPRPAPAKRTPPPPKVGAKGATSPRPEEGKAAGHTMPRNRGTSNVAEEPAGHTMPPKPGPGHPGPGDGGDVYKDERTDVKEPPSPPTTIADRSDVDETAGAADQPEFEDQVATVVGQVAAGRPEWSKRRVVEAVREALADGRDPQIVLAAVRLVAADPQTRVPGRLNEEGGWWAEAARLVHRSEPAPAEPKVWCDRHHVRFPESAGCRLCTQDGPNGAPEASEGPDGVSEIDPRGLAFIPAKVRERVRERLAGGVRS